ncbi:hypothetical protein SKAU_G00260890 [Synaphobranchus kaupii]|uniref:Uncharacterized protein n=1 Tax=Synaphobranchus kaupii TaxID=118154 RepID=A0A9Q1IQQ6_SYNKA|nr:hypothetical protein SKAU_G00260890 [Synaphobranchus kaupii]
MEHGFNGCCCVRRIAGGPHRSHMHCRSHHMATTSLSWPECFFITEESQQVSCSSPPPPPAPDLRAPDSGPSYERQAGAGDSRARPTWRGGRPGVTPCPPPLPPPLQSPQVCSVTYRFLPRPIESQPIKNQTNKFTVNLTPDREVTVLPNTDCKVDVYPPLDCRITVSLMPDCGGRWISNPRVAHTPNWRAEGAGPVRRRGEYVACWRRGTGGQSSRGNTVGSVFQGQLCPAGF